MKMLSIILFLLLPLAKGTNALTLTGYVYDESGEALTGVNVIVKGTASGTVTDIHGFYSLEALHEKVTLIFSFVGYAAQEVQPKGPMTNVFLSADAQMLNEVVVICYGTTTRRNINGAMSVTKNRRAKRDKVSGRFRTEATPELEEYAQIHDQGFLGAIFQPLSTFSIDVDVAS